MDNLIESLSNPILQTECVLILMAISFCLGQQNILKTRANPMRGFKERTPRHFRG